MAVKDIHRIALVLTMMAFAPAIHAQLLKKSQLDTAKVYTNLSQALLHPELVYRLDLSRKRLKTFPDEILTLSNLNDLRLNKNKIQVIPNEISRLPFLQKLECVHCELDTITPGILQLPHLRHLDLGDNYIRVIPQEIDRLEKLELLALWDNPINVYPQTLGNLRNLKMLDLLHNQMNGGTQDRLRTLLPATRVVLSAPCRCEDGEY